MWLGWLKAIDELDPDASPGQRCTPERLREFIQALLSRDKPSNAEIKVRHLATVVAAFDPESPRAHMTNATRHLKRQMRFRAMTEIPAIDEFLELADDLRELGLTGADGREIVDFARLRDAMVTAMLPRRPFRRFNFAHLTYGEGQDIQLIGGRYWIYISPSTTKTRKSTPKPFPAKLVPQFEEYLAARDRILRGAPPTNCLWISNRRRLLAPPSMSDAMARRSKAKFGEPYRTHVYRNVAASHARDGEMAAKLLDNTPEVARGTYRHDCKAQALSDFHEMLGLKPKSTDETFDE